MNILLLSHGFLPGQKEATKITITTFKQQLAKEGHNVVLIADRNIKSTIKKARKFQKEMDTEFDIVHGFSAAPIMVAKTVLVRKLLLPGQEQSIH
jgi:fibrillarin-like rRNA methylase